MLKFCFRESIVSFTKLKGKKSPLNYHRPHEFDSRRKSIQIEISYWGLK